MVEHEVIAEWSGGLAEESLITQPALDFVSRIRNFQIIPQVVVTVLLDVVISEFLWENSQDNKKYNDSKILFQMFSKNMKLTLKLMKSGP